MPCAILIWSGGSVAVMDMMPDADTRAAELRSLVADTSHGFGSSLSPTRFGRLVGLFLCPFLYAYPALSSMHNRSDNT